MTQSLSRPSDEQVPATRPPSALEPQVIDDLKEMFEQKIPFNRVMSLQITKIEPDRVAGRFAMKRDWVGNYARETLHGGLIGWGFDAIAGLAVMAAVAGRYPGETPAQRLDRFAKLATIDLRVDFLRPPISTNFELRANVLRLGSRLASIRMELLSAHGRLLASGACAYAVG
jgi:acyl-coenzyme A thioesterase PaaI-like protein